MKHTHSAALVADLAFGEKVWDLAKTVHVWMLESETNRAASENYWAANKHSGSTQMPGITLFFDQDRISVEDDCADLVHAIIDHEYGTESECTEIHVYGLGMNCSLVKQELSGLGFPYMKETGYGFVAGKQPWKTFTSSQ